MLERLALPTDAWAGLRDHAHERGLVFLSTPFDDGSAELLDRLGVPAFKVGSGRAHQPARSSSASPGAAARCCVSTGMADMVEVAAAVDAIARRRRSAARAVPLRLQLSGRPGRREPAGDRDPPRARSGCRSAGPTTRPASSSRIAVGRGRRDADREAPDAGSDAARARTTRRRSSPAEFARDGRRRPRRRRRPWAPATRSRSRRSAAIAAVARRSLHWARDAAGRRDGRPTTISSRCGPGPGLPPGRRRDLAGRATTCGRSRPATIGRPGDVEGPT